MQGVGVPLKYTKAVSPTAMDTPVWPDALTVTVLPVAALTTTYVRLDDGGVRTLAVVRVPVTLIMANCADTVPAPVKEETMFVALESPLVSDRVTAPSLVKVTVPATAISTYLVMPLSTMSPHVPESSPSTGSARERSVDCAVAM